MNEPAERRTRLEGNPTRRRFLKLAAGTALFSAWAAADDVDSSTPGHATNESSAVKAVRGTLKRVLPDHADQIHLLLSSPNGTESFRIGGSAGRIQITASTTSALLMGVGWYLKYGAGVSVSWNGDCLNCLPSRLPAPGQPLLGSANVKHRFALNDTNDAYTGPYWSWEQWEHLIDVLALHGMNEMLVYMGAEAVYQRTFRKFHLSGEALRHWFPTPAHQPWWLLDNMAGWVGPSTSQEVIDTRLTLAQRITNRLRELGMVPVLPGYYGILPDGFAARYPGAPIIPQGKWLGMKRPDWLDPTSDLFAEVAAEYYRTQRDLLGPSSMFKMDPLHEGGESGEVNITHAAGAIHRQLQKARPGAVWAILGWQNNPRKEVLAGIPNKQCVLILDGQADRYEDKDREAEWDNTPYAFGTIWNFGGHTTIGANLGVWNQRYFDQLRKPGSALSGIAILPEASCNNPAAFEFFSELAWRVAWRAERLDLPAWFAEWSSFRYGGKDAGAARAWAVLCSTAYDMKSGQWSEAHDNLFSAQPSLDAKSACTWSPPKARYDLDAFSLALPLLMKVEPALRNSSAYRYDLVDVARQTIANRSRILLPEIAKAYSAGDLAHFRELTRAWLKDIDSLDRIAATEPALLFGLWLSQARKAGGATAEQAQLEFDASSLLLEWGPASSRESGVHDYANREWNGLLQYYGKRWRAFFSALEASLSKKEPIKPIDWFDMDQEFAKAPGQFANSAQGSPYEVIHQIFHSDAETMAVLRRLPPSCARSL